MRPREFFGKPVRAVDVRFGSEADMCSAQAHVRYTPESDTKCDMMECPLWANSGHSPRPSSLVRRQRRRGAFEFEDKTVRVIGSTRLCMQSGWQDFLNQSGPETAIRRLLYDGPTVFHPLEFELVGLRSPRDFNATGAARPCTILGRIRAQFIHQH